MVISSARHSQLLASSATSWHMASIWASVGGIVQ
jgi:hypothetical protein